jgi:hypothetical protein
VIDQQIGGGAFISRLFERNTPIIETGNQVKKAFNIDIDPEVYKMTL